MTSVETVTVEPGEPASVLVKVLIIVGIGVGRGTNASEGGGVGGGEGGKHSTLQTSGHAW